MGLLWITDLLRNFPWGRGTAFLHTFVAQHKGRGTGEGMLRDLHKSQSGDMEGLIETRGLSGKKGGKSALSTEFHSKKKPQDLQHPSGLIQSATGFIPEYLRKESKCFWSHHVAGNSIDLVARCNPK